MSVDELINELLEDPNFRKEFYKKDLAFEISEMIIDLRIKLGLTQSKLAKKIGTQQSSIARLERGNFLPSLSFLMKIAKALNIDLISPKFSILEKKDSFTNSESYNCPVYNKEMKSEMQYFIPTIPEGNKYLSININNKIYET